MTILGWVSGWAVASNERAVANARGATTACSRRRVEREEVAQLLATAADRGETTPVVTRGSVASLSG